MHAEDKQVSVMPPRDHGGGVDAAVARWGGTRAEWLDLSTGINPVPYPLPEFTAADWNDLPDRSAQDALLRAARDFWQVPEGADILAAPGASALIARIPALMPAGTVDIPTPTYNEHAAAFAAQGCKVGFVDKDVETAKALVAQVDGDVAFEPCDLRDIDSLKTAFDKLADRQGAAQVLVNNAARDDRHD